MQKLYKISALTLILCLICSLFSINAVAANPAIVIDSTTVENGGFVKIIGHLTNVPATSNKQIEVAFVSMLEGSSLTINNDDLAYINQYSLGNNYTFLIQFKANSKFSNKTLDTRISAVDLNNQDWVASTSLKLIMKTIPPTIDNVVNNSVIYGVDAYTLDSKFLTTEYVVDSIVTGGNLIYYKIGNYWYDLLDPRCTSSEFLVSANALTMDFMNTLTLRYYYYKFDKQTFKTK